MPPGLKDKITDQNIYPKNPLQKLQKYFTLKIPYKNPKYFENIFAQIGLLGPEEALKKITEAILYSV